MGKRAIPPAGQVGRSKRRHESISPEAPIPVFVIFRDRLTDLQEFIRAMHEAVHTPFELVIHDTGSQHQPTLEYLRWLRSTGLKVLNATTEEGMQYRTLDGSSHAKLIGQHPKAWNFLENTLNSVQESIAKYFHDLQMLGAPMPNFYVVTDPDVSLFDVPGDVMDVLQHVLNLGEASVAALGLRQDEIVEHHGFLQQEMWPETLESFKFGARRIYYIRNVGVDTTFAMYNKNFKFHRANQGVRLSYPYAARHLDWYYSNLSHVPEDFRFYLCTCNPICSNGPNILRRLGLKCGQDWLSRREALSTIPMGSKDEIIHYDHFYRGEEVYFEMNFYY